MATTDKLFPQSERLHSSDITNVLVDMGKVKVLMESQAGRIQDLATSVEKLTTKVEAIDRTLNQASGGWRVLMLVGGAGSAIGAAVVWILTHMTFRV